MDYIIFWVHFTYRQMFKSKLKWTGVFYVEYLNCILQYTLVIGNGRTVSITLLVVMLLHWLSPLFSCLQQLTSDFQKSSQQCVHVAEFLQEFWRLFDENADHLQSMGLIPTKCNLEFLTSLCFSLKSEVLCGRTTSGAVL